MLVHSLRYFTARVHAIIVFLGRIDQSTVSRILPFYSKILQEEGKFEISARKTRPEYAAFEKGKFPLRVALRRLRRRRLTRRIEFVFLRPSRDFVPFSALEE